MLIDWLVSWLVGLLQHRLACQLVGKLVDSVVYHFIVYQQVDLIASWLVDFVGLLVVGLSFG